MSKYRIINIHGRICIQRHHEAREHNHQLENALGDIVEKWTEREPEGWDFVRDNIPTLEEAERQLNLLLEHGKVYKEVSNE